jgi:hypothetical protein
MAGRKYTGYSDLRQENLGPCEGCKRLEHCTKWCWTCDDFIDWAKALIANTQTFTVEGIWEPTDEQIKKLEDALEAERLEGE